MSGEYVGIDLHKRNTVMVRVDAEGNRLEQARFDSNPVALAQAVARAGEGPEVIIEATCNWYWAFDTLVESGARVRLAHPGGFGWGERRVKNDVNDAAALITMARLGVLPQAWPAPPAVRELRELVRYRAKLVELRTGLKSQTQSTLGKQAVRIPGPRLWGPNRQALVAETDLNETYPARVQSLFRLIDTYTAEIARLGVQIEQWVADDVGYQAIRKIKGFGPILAAVFVAEIGDIHRFRRHEQLASWAGLTPQAAGVRHQKPPGSGDQARIRAGPMGGHRGHLESP